MFILALAACFFIPSEREMKHDYEWFHDAYNQIEAKVNQIHGHQQLLADTTDAKELQRLRIELSGMQQSCRSLVGEYNANSNKVNVGISQGWSLPNHIDADSCEVK